MSDVRAATAADIDEIIRLRTMMLQSMDGIEVPDGPWIANAVESLRERIASADQTFATFVVDQADHPGRLACCASGLIDTKLGSPSNPSGRFGYVFNVSTDWRYRRRGYARACMEVLLSWYAEQGVTTIDLKTSVDGEPLYRSMGFRPSVVPLLRYVSER